MATEPNYKINDCVPQKRGSFKKLQPLSCDTLLHIFVRQPVLHLRNYRVPSNKWNASGPQQSRRPNVCPSAL